MFSRGGVLFARHNRSHGSRVQGARTKQAGQIRNSHEGVMRAGRATSSEAATAPTLWHASCMTVSDWSEPARFKIRTTAAECIALIVVAITILPCLSAR